MLCGLGKDKVGKGLVTEMSSAMLLFSLVQMSHHQLTYPYNFGFISSYEKQCPIN